jgi:hypothetical protein
MTNNTDKEKWIDEVMSSTAGMSRANPDTDLFNRISSKLNVPQVVKSTPLPVKQWAAAAILLLALNVGSILYYRNQHTHAEATETTYNY